MKQMFRMLVPVKGDKEGTYTSLTTRSTTPRPDSAAHARRPRHERLSLADIAAPEAIDMESSFADVRRTSFNQESDLISAPSAEISKDTLASTPRLVRLAATPVASPVLPEPENTISEPVVIGGVTLANDEVKDQLVPTQKRQKLIIQTLKFAGRIVEESIALMVKGGTSQITTVQLKEMGIRNLGLGPGDVNRIKYLCSTLMVNGGDIDPILPMSIDNSNVYPAHIINVAVMISMSTSHPEQYVTIALNAFNKIRNETKAMYRFAADFALEKGVEEHASKAYAAYVKILIVRDDVDTITFKRVEAIEAWVGTLRDEIERASEEARRVEEARMQAWLTGMMTTKYRAQLTGNVVDTDEAAL
jgi:uncharacterized protein YijF (DUF1287 family)